MRGRLLVRLVAIVGLVALAACRPSLDDDISLVTTPRILAVRAEPAEAKPGEAVTLSALYTDGTTVTAPALGWRFCASRRALAEAGPIDPACLTGTAATAIGAGSEVAAIVPRDACRAFGPDPPLAAKAGEPAGRPADPDGTGGFFLPGIVLGGGASAIEFELRIRCSLPPVTADVARDFERRYRPNTNPVITELARVDGERVGDMLVVARAEHVALRVSWPGSDEAYPSFDPTSRALVDRREAIVVSWLATAGTFTQPRTGATESDPTTASENTWTAPPSPTHATLFVILRDARGGTTFRTVATRVE